MQLKHMVSCFNTKPEVTSSLQSIGRGTMRHGGKCHLPSLMHWGCLRICWLTCCMLQTATSTAELLLLYELSIICSASIHCSTAVGANNNKPLATDLLQFSSLDLQHPQIVQSFPMIGIQGHSQLETLLSPIQVAYAYRYLQICRRRAHAANLVGACWLPDHWLWS